MKKIKVLHVINEMNSGGAEKVIMNWYRNIDSNFEFDFLVRAKGNFYKNEIESRGGRIILMPSFPRHFIRNFIETRRFLINNKYDVVHVHGNSLIYIYPLIIARSLNIPVRIMHIHSTKANGKIASLIHCINKKMINKYANYRFACSEKAGRFGFGNSEFTVIRNGIDIDRYAQDEAYLNNLRKELDIGVDTIVLGHVGRFLPVKNHRFIVETFKDFLLMHPNSKLVLVGEGPEKENIINYVNDFGISDNVCFLGERNDVEKILYLFDCVIFPSIYEGMPLVLLEAQIAERKVVCSNVIDNKAVITPYVKVMSLDMSSKKWAEEIQYFIHKEIKCNVKKAFMAVGMDIYSVTERLEEIYRSGSCQKIEL